MIVGSSFATDSDRIVDYKRGTDVSNLCAQKVGVMSEQMKVKLLIFLSQNHYESHRSRRKTNQLFNTKIEKVKNEDGNKSNPYS